MSESKFDFDIPVVKFKQRWFPGMDRDTKLIVLACLWVFFGYVMLFFVLRGMHFGRTLW